MANDIAYGFIDLQHLFSQRVVPEMVPTIQTALQQSFDMHNRMVTAMLDLLVRPTADYMVRYQQSGAGEAQPLTPKGNPVVVRPEGAYDVAFPIKHWGWAYGLDEVARAHATMEDLNRFAINAMVADLRRIQRHILAAWYTNTTYTYSDEAHGNLTVQPLANGDTVEYTLVTGAKATANHFHAINNTIGDANNPYEWLYNTLTNYPGNAGPYFAFIPTGLVAATQALTGFEEVTDPNLIYGANTTRANATIDPDNPVSNSPLTMFGNNLIGYVNHTWVVASRILPANYVLGVATGADPAFGMREYAPAELRGVRYSQFSPDGNEIAYRTKRSAGFGAMNRVAAAVVRMSAASYAVPTGYNAGTEVN